MTEETAQRKRRKKAPDMADTALEELVKKTMGEALALTEGQFNSIMQDLGRRVLQTALQTEMQYHLDGKPVLAQESELEAPQAPQVEASERSKNKRNGTTRKQVKTPFGPIILETPRDRIGEFEPLVVPKHARTLSTLNERIIALYARGMSTRDISKHLEELYGVEVSAEFISSATDTVLKDVEEWQNRPLESIYPVVFFDAMRVKIRSGGGIKNLAVHFALAVQKDGRRDVLGMWINDNEGAAYWTSVFSGLKARGVTDILIAVTDGLKGMTEALEAVFPQTLHQTCIVHLIRSSTTYVSYKDRKAACEGLKAIYQAVDADAAERALEAFEESALGKRYPSIAAAWRRVWAQVIPFFNFEPEIRTLIYTTNSIEGLNRAVRKVIKTRTLFPSEDAAKKLVYLAIRNFTKDWKRPMRKWSDAMGAFATTFGERFTESEI